MPITYTEANAIEKNSWFRDRVRVAVSTYTNYLLNTPAEDPQFQEKIDAAQRLATQSDSVVNTLMFTLSGDSEVQTAGPCIGDAQLQAIVEKTIQKFWPVATAPAIPFGAAPPYYMPGRAQ